MKKRIFALALCALSMALSAFPLHYSFPPMPPKWKALPTRPGETAGSVKVQNGKLILSSASGNFQLYLDQPFAAQKGDCFAISAEFQGRGSVMTGIFGYDKGRGVRNELRTFKVQEGASDRRTTVIEVTDAQTNQVRFTFGVAPGSEVALISFSVRKLSPEESALFSVSRNRADWFAKTKGINLAAGKKVQFDPVPSYPLTAKGDTDTTDLTDGQLARQDDLIWFDTKAVAFLRAYQGATMIVDLGSIQPVDKTVIRLCGGGASGVRFPKELEVWVSKDGIGYHRATRMTKLPPLESNLADGKKFFYLPEDESGRGTAYVHALEMGVHADARFVALRAPVYTPASMISDEWAVIKADDAARKHPGYNQAYQSQARPLVHRKVILRPRMDTFYICENLALPNRLRMDDRRPDKKGKFGYIIDLPSEIKFIPDVTWPKETRTLIRTEKNGNRTRYHFEPAMSYATFEHRIDSIGLGPFYFTAPEPVRDTNERYAVFTTTVDGKEHHAERVRLETFHLKPSPRPKELFVSIGWIMPGYAATWPGYLDTMAALGFNVISFFYETPGSGAWIPAEARKRGFKIALQASPTGMACRTAPPEFYCSSGKTVCPSYRGTAYKAMLNRITDGVKQYPGADYVVFDEESWEGRNMDNILQCSRCEAVRREKNLTPAEFLAFIQADYLKEFKPAVMAGIPKDAKKTMIGFYGLNPEFGYVCSVGKIPFSGGKKLHPAHSDMLQPSYYGRSSAEAGNIIRAAAGHEKNPRRLIPWITGGAGAYNEGAYPKRTGEHLLECLMNGAGGAMYYRYESFESPIDFASPAEVMRMVAPYEKIILDGEQVHVPLSPSSVRSCAKKLGKQTLLLVDHYEKLLPLTATPPKTRKITDLRSGRILAAGEKLHIQADDYGFYLLEE